MSRDDVVQTDALGPEEFLEHLRGAGRHLVKSDVMNVLRRRCDVWTLDAEPVDPLEPLVNRGRRTIVWAADTWSLISADLLVAAEHGARDENDQLPSVLAEYCVYVHLELAAREEPPMGVRPAAFVFPLIIAARERAKSSEFRRYAVGWRARAGSLPWNNREMSFAAALAMALGSTEDAAIGASVRSVRKRLEEDGGSGSGRFRDLVDSDHRDAWRRAASASALDAAAWAKCFMR